MSSVTPPLDSPADPDPRRRTPAEEARTLVAYGTTATLATLSEDGHPWGSLVTYAALDDGAPVLLLSTLAEHGRNLMRDQRASLVVAEAGEEGDPLDRGRVTLAGRAERPEGEQARAALDAFVAATPAASAYADFGDFSLWILRIERVRWVGGYGRMGSVGAAAYQAAEPDPVAPAAVRAITHLNDDHADALLAIARALMGYADATAATCTGADRYGLDLRVNSPRGEAVARVAFAETIDEPDGLRAATVALTRRARDARS